MRQLPLIVVLTIAAAILLWNLSFYDVDAAGPASSEADAREGATPESLEGWPEVVASVDGETEQVSPVELASHGSSGRPHRAPMDHECPDGPVTGDDDEPTAAVTGTSSTPAVDESILHRRVPPR